MSLDSEDEAVVEVEKEVEAKGRSSPVDLTDLEPDELGMCA